jgi:hypothetical protein
LLGSCHNPPDLLLVEAEQSRKLGEEVLAGDLGRHLTPEEPRRAAIHLFDLYRFSHPDISVQPIRILA